MPYELGGFIMIRSFFFQAEDGIRVLTVTGVQTCALPISPAHRPASAREVGDRLRRLEERRAARNAERRARSEERRVGKECSFCLPAYHYRRIFYGSFLLPF